MNTPRPFSRRLTLVVAATVAVVALSAAIWKVSFSREPEPIGAGDDANPVAASHEPELSLATVRHVIASGGGRLTREAAIAWLDQQARQRLALEVDAEKALLDLLRDGHGHANWSFGYRQHLFNSACNALRVRPSDSGESLARILQSHATSHPDRVLRLYALQHIDSLRRSGHLTGVLADEIRATLQSLASSPESDVAGTAILLMAAWEGPAAAVPPAVLELAAKTAADRARSTDIRVSAIHSAGPAALETARAIAADPTEPMLLRKAAIAQIGHHGQSADLASLKSLRSESARLAQAADPALRNLLNRLRVPNPPAPVPYP